MQIDGHGFLMSSVARSGSEMLKTIEEWHGAMLEKGRRAAGPEAGTTDDTPVPGEQPKTEQVPPIDYAPVPPLTTPADTEGG